MGFADRTATDGLAWLRREIGVVAAFGLAAGGTLAFLAIAGAVADGDTTAFDGSLLRLLRTPDDPADPLGPPWLEVAVRDVTVLGGNTVLTLAGVLVVGFLLTVRAFGAAAFVTVSLVGGSFLGVLLKDLYDRPRPDLVAHVVAVATPSFPSGYAMQSAIVWLTLGALLSRAVPVRAARLYVLGAACALTLAVGSSRVYLGVHWPTDVLAGWCVGSAWAMGCWLLAALMRRRPGVRRPRGRAHPADGT
jgi:undecaprenyl-diphosphatase